MTTTSLLVLLVGSTPTAPAEPSELNASLAYAAAATGAAAVAGAAAITAGVLVHSVPFDVNGRPSPWVTTGALALTAALNAALTHFALPWLAQALRGAPELSAVREHAWQRSRWALVGGGAGVVTFAVGAGLEHGSFGRGQAVMLTGALVTIASVMVWDLVELVASWAGAEGGARQHRSAP